MKRIGLLLGSFDPIHAAHVNIASCVLNSGLCDIVLFVVAKHNPWKQHEPADFDLRCQMVNASIAGLKNCDVCRLEENIEPPSYSYKVINELLMRFPEDEFILICGSDTIEKVPNWKRFESDIKNKVGFIEIKRDDGVEIENPYKPFIVHEGSMSSLTDKGFWYIKTQRMDISSTLVRNMVAHGMNPIPLVNKETLDIINKYNLYR